MRNEINPAVFWGALGVIVVALVGFWLLHNRTSPKMETGGSEESMQKAKNGTFYQPRVPLGPQH